MLALFECSYDVKSLARLVTAEPGSHGIRKFGEAREAECTVLNRTDRQGRLDLRHLFRNVSSARLLWDLTGSLGSMRQPLGSRPLKGVEAKAFAMCAPIPFLLPLLLHRILFRH